MRTPAELAQEIVGANGLRQLHDPLDMIDRITTVIEQERQHQAKLEAERDGALADYEVFHAKSRRLEQQLAQLQAWKESAMKVMPDFQKIGQLLGVGLGENVSENIIPKIEQLQEENEHLKTADSKACAALIAQHDEDQKELAQLQLEVGRKNETLREIRDVMQKDGRFIRTVPELDKILSHPTPPLYSAVVELVEAAENYTDSTMNCEKDNSQMFYHQQVRDKLLTLKNLMGRAA